MYPGVPNGGGVPRATNHVLRFDGNYLTAESILRDGAMSTSTQAPKGHTSSSQSRQLRRLWRAPRSNVWWISLLGALLLSGLIAAYFVKTGGFADKPGTGSLPRFGIIAFFLLPIPLAYTL